MKRKDGILKKKCKIISNRVEKIVESKGFNIIVILLIIFNTVFLALEYDG